MPFSQAVRVLFASICGHCFILYSLFPTKQKRALTGETTINNGFCINYVFLVFKLILQMVINRRRYFSLDVQQEVFAINKSQLIFFTPG